MEGFWKIMPDNKKYVIIDVPSKRQLVIAAEHWVVGKKLCLYPTDQTDMHLQNNDRPNDNWSVLKCKVVHKCDSLQSANDLLVSFKNSDVYQTNCLSDENILPLNFEEQKKDVAEMQAGNIHVQYPKLRMFDPVVSDCQVGFFTL
ncbi:unnamed protein product [Schistosoma rodhaini]|uniref:Uncharacterized protein n=1 Tax=Schistosoma rodhaini TaxID=6188 RepID=A0AA85FLS0_9TREM|nr:unnamed protein product [Schistosoma rodhaini]